MMMSHSSRTVFDWASGEAGFPLIDAGLVMMNLRTKREKGILDYSPKIESDLIAVRLSALGQLFWESLQHSDHSRFPVSNAVNGLAI